MMIDHNVTINELICPASPRRIDFMAKMHGNEICQRRGRFPPREGAVARWLCRLWLGAHLAEPKMTF